MKFKAFQEYFINLNLEKGQIKFKTFCKLQYIFIYHSMPLIFKIMNSLVAGDL